MRSIRKKKNNTLSSCGVYKKPRNSALAANVNAAVTKDAADTVVKETPASVPESTNSYVVVSLAFLTLR